MNAIAIADSMDGGNAVRLVRSTLSGPVLGLLRDMMPELSSVPSGSAFLRVFGHDSLPAALERFILHAQNAHMGPERSLEEVAGFATTIFKRRAPGPGR